MIGWAVGIELLGLLGLRDSGLSTFNSAAPTWRMVILCQPAYDGTLDTRYLQLCGPVLFGHGKSSHHVCECPEPPRPALGVIKSRRAVGTHSEYIAVSKIEYFGGGIDRRIADERESYL